MVSDLVLGNDVPRSPQKKKKTFCFFLSFFVETFSIMDLAAAAGGGMSEYNDYAIFFFFFFFFQSIQIDCIVTYRKRRRRVTVK
jgi:hypothetical protein